MLSTGRRFGPFIGVEAGARGERIVGRLLTVGNVSDQLLRRNGVDVKPFINNDLK